MYIGEVSKRSGASAKAIRLYESLGVLINIKRKGQYRFYDEKDVEFIKLIKEAQTLGISLAEIKQLVVGRNQLNWQLVIELLHHKQNAFDEEIKRLAVQKNRVQDYLMTIKHCSNLA